MSDELVAEALITAEIKAYERSISQNLDAKSWYLSMAHKAELQIVKAERAVDELRAAFDAVRSLR